MIEQLSHPCRGVTATRRLCTPLPDLNGQEQEWAGEIANSPDLAERKQAAEALRQQREWLRVILSSINDAVLVTDPQGRVAFLNGMAQALTGWVEAEVIGRPLEEVYHVLSTRTRERIESPLATVLRVGPVYGLDSILVARDGSERPIEDSATPICDERGKVSGVVVVFRDVTVRQRAEKAIAQLAAILESSEGARFPCSSHGSEN